MTETMTIDELMEIDEADLGEIHIYEYPGDDMVLIKFELARNPLILSDGTSIPMFSKFEVPNTLKKFYDKEWKDHVAETLSPVFRDSEIDKVFMVLGCVNQDDLDESARIMIQSGVVKRDGKSVRFMPQDESSMCTLFGATFPLNIPAPPSLIKSILTKNKEMAEEVCKKILNMPSYLNTDTTGRWVISVNEKNIAI